MRQPDIPSRAQSFALWLTAAPAAFGRCLNRRGHWLSHFGAPPITVTYDNSTDTINVSLVLVPPCLRERSTALLFAHLRMRGVGNQIDASGQAEIPLDKASCKTADASMPSDMQWY